MTEKIKTVLLFGAPGCGKGTQGKMVGTLPGFLHVASGDLFRALDRTSELGKIFVQYSTKGELVPDDFTVRLWRDHMQRLTDAHKLDPATDVVVLDGIPRNVKQAEMLADHITVLRLVVLSVDRDREEVVRRLRLRATKEGRLDDAKEEVVRRRLEVYDRESRPVIDYFPSKRRVEVDALQTPLEVAHDVLCAILGRTDELHPIPSPVAAGAGSKR
jgi:adenylate kinase